MKKSNGTIPSLNVMNSLAAITENANRSLDTTEIGSEAIRKLKKNINKKSFDKSR